MTDRTIVLPITDELLEDFVPVADLIRFEMIASVEWRYAVEAGRLTYRGGGWYRLDDRTVRGRHRVRKILVAEASR